MQVKSTQFYRVRDVAEALNVSVATIYRAVESGALRAVRHGTGKGAVRISDAAVAEYLAAGEQAATRIPVDGQTVDSASGATDVLDTAEWTKAWQDDVSAVRLGLPRTGKTGEPAGGAA